MFMWPIQIRKHKLEMKCDPSCNLQSYFQPILSNKKQLVLHHNGKSGVNIPSHLVHNLLIWHHPIHVEGKGAPHFPT